VSETYASCPWCGNLISSKTEMLCSSCLKRHKKIRAAAFEEVWERLTFININPDKHDAMLELVNWLRKKQDGEKDDG